VIFAGRYGQDLTDAARLVARVAAILSIGAGVIHVSAAGDHTNLPVMFAGFLAVAALQVALGALLLWRRPSRLLVTAALLLMVGSVGVWLWSRTSGLPFLEDGHTEPVGFKDGITVLFEVASIPPLLLLLSRDLAQATLPSPRLAHQTSSLVGVACFALMVPALMLGGGGHHSHEQAVELGLHTDDHGQGEELAHADTQSHGRDPNAGHHATKKGESDGHAHTGDANGSSGHRHSGTQLASAPLGGSHSHGGGGDNPPRHDAGEHDAGGEGDHHDGQHRRGRPDRDHGHGPGHGDHEGEEPGDESGDEPPLSVSYEPEPSVCISGFCVP